MRRLPDDIPGRQILVNAGFINYNVLINHRSIGSIRGVGSKLEKEIKDYLSGNKESSSDYTVRQIRKKADEMSKEELADFIEGDERKSVQALLD